MQSHNRQLLYVSLPEITESDGTFHAFIPDHQGNIAGVYNSATDSLEQFTDYYPYGLPHASATAPEANRRKYGAKELTTDLGLNLYDFAARFHNPAFPAFTTPDPMATDYYPISPYVYCGGDPINLVDPTGMHTLVKSIGNGQYEVIGGELNNDRNIYLCVETENGEPYNTWKSIGQSVTPTSFYNSDTHKWATGTVIDTNDNSGVDFISQFRQSDRPSFIYYMQHAGNGQIYDFKETNGEENVHRKDIEWFYRGMRLFRNKKVYGSARDIGNIIAGYYCGIYDIKWAHARAVFDLYQSKGSTQLIKEGISSQTAQFYGYSLGKQEMYTLSVKSIKEKSVIKDMLSTCDEALTLLYIYIQMFGK